MLFVFSMRFAAQSLLMESSNARAGVYFSYHVSLRVLRGVGCSGTRWRKVLSMTERL